MDRKVFDRIEAILKEDRFKGLEVRTSPHSLSVSGERDGTRVVVHMTDRDEEPHRAAPSENFPAARQVRMRVSMPGHGLAVPQGPATGFGGAAEEKPKISRG